MVGFAFLTLSKGNLYVSFSQNFHYQLRSVNIKFFYDLQHLLPAEGELRTQLVHPCDGSIPMSSGWAHSCVCPSVQMYL